MKSIKISRNQQLHTLHVKNITEWLHNTNHKMVQGDTLFFDYIYFVHPTAIGHWCVCLGLSLCLVQSLDTVMQCTLGSCSAATFSCIPYSANMSMQQVTSKYGSIMKW